MASGPSKSAAGGRPPSPSPFLRTVGPVLAGIAVIAVLGGVLWGISAWVTARQRDDPENFQVQVGDEAFDAGRYERLLTRIERDGPLLFPDLLVGGDLNVYVNHVGPTPQEGWVAFEAKAPGADVTCTLRWDGAARQFADPCTGAHYPPGGDGLRAFPTEIDVGGHLIMRLKPPAP